MQPKNNTFLWVVIALVIGFLVGWVIHTNIPSATDQGAAGATAKLSTTSTTTSTTTTLQGTQTLTPTGTNPVTPTVNPGIDPKLAGIGCKPGDIKAGNINYTKNIKVGNTTVTDQNGNLVARELCHEYTYDLICSTTGAKMNNTSLTAWDCRLTSLGAVPIDTTGKPVATSLTSSLQAVLYPIGISSLDINKLVSQIIST